MSQKKSHSIAETLTTVLSGFLLSWAGWAFIVAPLYDIPFHLQESLEITTIFTVISLIRSYVIRRIYNWVMVKSRST
jgi:hypothetical protein